MSHKFKIDDVIICINDAHCSPPIKKGMKYIINDIYTCPTCGSVEFKLSIPFHNEKGGGMVCAACRTKIPDELCDTWWAEHWRFAPIEAKTQDEKNYNINLEPKKVLKEEELFAN